MKLIGGLIIFLGLNVAFQKYLTDQSLPFWVITSWNGLPSTLVGFGIVLLGATVLGAEARQRQRENDRVAKEIVGLAAKGQRARHKFALYLRSFRVDQKHVAPRPPGGMDIEGMFGSAGNALENILYEAIRDSYVTVALGSPTGEEFGFGQAGLLEDWQGAVRNLINNASIIFVMPSMDDGILWELGQISRMKLWDKVIFVMLWFPYEQGDVVSLNEEIPAERSVESYTDQWEKMRKHYENEFSVKLPPYNKEGAVFRFVDGQRSPVYKRFGYPVTPRKLARWLNAVLD